jgi:hypothetical protein
MVWHFGAGLFDISKPIIPEKTRPHLLEVKTLIRILVFSGIKKSNTTYQFENLKFK